MISTSKYRVVNIIANTAIGSQLNLSTIGKSLNNCEYEPEIYFALIYRLEKPKLSILVNKSGKIIFTGAKTLEDITAARDLFFIDLDILGYRPIKTDIIIQNIVFCVKINKSININNILDLNKEKNIKYNPEKFPGLILKNENPKFTATIFKNGNMNIIGLKNFDEILPALELLNGILSN
jgi:transcription initiation factor TFIID TATA-box-binding protein